MIRLEFTYTPEDMKEFAKAAPPRPPDAPRKSAIARGFFSWVLFVGLAVLVLVLMRHRDREAGPASPAPAPTRPGVVDILVPLLPWLLIFAVIWFFVIRQLRGQWQAAWQQNFSLQQPQVAEVDDDEGVTLSGHHASTRWQWAAFGAWAETDNLIILYQLDKTGLILPKRGAASPGDLQRLRDVLGARVVQPAGGFPVLPATEPRRPV